MDGDSVAVATGLVPADIAPKNHADCLNRSLPNFLHSPPDSNNALKSDASDSELSDLNDDEPALDGVSSGAKVSAEPPATEDNNDDIGEVLPDHWSGTVPVFKPTMKQFKDFKRFMNKVDSYGMKSGIIKVIPPQEWKDSQPKLDELVKQIRVREPIKQDIMGSNGTYRQVNILHGRSYNLPQWRQLCDQSEHQPPARRGERRANADKPKLPRPKPAVPKQPNTSVPKKKGRGRPARGKCKHISFAAVQDSRPMTPTSPKFEPEVVESVEQNTSEATQNHEIESTQTPPRRMGGIKPAKEKTQSVSARRKNGRREGSVAIDEEAFREFDYKMDISDYTAERCEELERVYWKTLTYAPPLYGADMMGTLFDDKTDIWNLNKLPNLLDVLGTKIPGVNTAYLYLGMWKATFAWHLEDVDLYSINYLHFGAPKQWYSISQADAPKFEKAMKSIWPSDAKSCSQFLRHKGYLISPQHLLTHYGIRVNKCLSYPGEFVVTYPYGYHSGYNLGYNCAEAVNFALDSWLPMGKIAKRCECSQAQDSVWIDVYEIERKLRGEPTPEYYEETEDDDEDDEDEDLSGLPSPPASHDKKMKNTRKRKQAGEKGAKLRAKKVRIRLKPMSEPPCCLCPNDYSGMELLPTNDGRKVHKMCALYIPETFIDNVEEQDVVCNLNNISQARRDLKCLYCRSKKGACFQCSQKRCARAYHATCAAAAGVFIEEQDVPVFGDDGVEYKEQAFEFSCRFHRTRRDKKLDGFALEGDKRIRSTAISTKIGDFCQFQYIKGDIFAGMILENRTDDETFLISIVPTSERIEVEWKWLLVADPNDYHLPKASANALPLPASQKARSKINAQRAEDDRPRKDDEFAEGYTWAEFHLCDEVSNKNQVKVDFSKPDQIWYYIGNKSTEAKAQYTEDPSKPRYNPKGNFLDTIPKPPRPVTAIKANQYRQYQQYRTPSGQLYYQYADGRPPLLMTPRNAIGQHYAQQQSYPATQLAGTPATSLPQGQSTALQVRHAPAQTPQRCPASSLPLSTSRPCAPVSSKYQFFQVNYNGDPSLYRTPYGPHTGFINGYEKNPEVNSTSSATQNSNALQGLKLQSLSTKADHTEDCKVLPTQAVSKPKATVQQKTYKIPAKESPVPLPPGFLAALSSSTALVKKAFRQPTPAGSQSSATPAGSQSTATPAGSQSTATSAWPNKGSIQPANAKQVQGAKISTTPVPLPSFALTAQQRALASRQGVQPKKSDPTTTGTGTSNGLGNVSGVTNGNGVINGVGLGNSNGVTNGAGVTHGHVTSGHDVTNGHSITNGIGHRNSVGVANGASTAAAVSATAADGVSTAPQTMKLAKQQEFADVPGRESMEFVEKMVQNLRRASQQGSQAQ